MGPDDGTSKAEYVHSSDVDPSQKLETMTSNNRNAGVIVQITKRVGGEKTFNKRSEKPHAAMRDIKR